MSLYNTERAQANKPEIDMLLAGTGKPQRESKDTLANA
jgi:hypothetical protein